MKWVRMTSLNVAIGIAAAVVATATVLAACGTAPDRSPQSTGAVGKVTDAPQSELTVAVATSAGAQQAVATEWPSAAVATDGEATDPAMSAPATARAGCAPTPPDGLGPFYVAGAPVRSSVGSGYVLSGQVLSTDGCAVLPGSQIEAWMAGPDGQYGDAYRATFFAASSGAYRFESPVPVAYEGRPPHIHLRVTAPGHAVLVTQHYPASGATTATFDLVLTPE